MMVLFGIISPRLWESAAIIKDILSKVSIKSIEVDIFGVIYASLSHLSRLWHAIFTCFLCFLHLFCWFAVLSTALTPPTWLSTVINGFFYAVDRSWLPNLQRDPDWLLTRCLWWSTTPSQEWKEIHAATDNHVFLSAHWMRWKERMHPEARVHIGFYEWNKRRLQLSRRSLRAWMQHTCSLEGT